MCIRAPLLWPRQRAVRVRVCVCVSARWRACVCASRARHRFFFPSPLSSPRAHRSPEPRCSQWGKCACPWLGSVAPLPARLGRCASLFLSLSSLCSLSFFSFSLSLRFLSLSPPQRRARRRRPELASGYSPKRALSSLFPGSRVLLFEFGNAGLGRFVVVVVVCTNFRPCSVHMPARGRTAVRPRGLAKPLRVTGVAFSL